MVKGLDRFRERFAANSAGFVLIGGAACHEWFARQALTFRATKDLDLVIVVEALDDAFVQAFRAFVEDGGYRTASASTARRSCTASRRRRSRTSHPCSSCSAASPSGWSSASGSP